MSNIAGRESRESTKKSNEDVAGQNVKRSREELATGVGSKEPSKKLAERGEDSKISSPKGNARNPNSNAAYEAIKLFNEQQAAKKIGSVFESKSFEQSANLAAKPVATAIASSNTASPFNPIPHSSLTKDIKESWLLTVGTSLPSSTKGSKESLDIALDLQKRKDSSASQNTTHVLSSSAKQTTLPKSTDGLLAQLRNNASLKITSSQQTMIDSRSMSGLAVVAGGDVAAASPPRSMAASAAVGNGRVNISRRSTVTTTANDKDSTNSNSRNFSTTREELAKYKQIMNDDISEDFLSDFGGQQKHANLGRARPSVGRTSSTSNPAGKSPFGSGQVANGPFQPAIGGSKSQFAIVDSYDQESEPKVTGKKQTSQLGNDVKDEASNYRVKALKTIHSSGIEEKNRNQDFGFDQDSIFAVKGNVHLVQCFPSGGSPFILNNGWETEGNLVYLMLLDDFDSIFRHEIQCMA